MRLALIADIHGNLTAFDAVLADLKQAGEADLIWILGDLAAFGPRPAECIRRVQAMVEQHGKEKCKVIGGNTDRYLVTGERFPIRPVKKAESFQKLASEWEARDRILNWNVGQLVWEDYEYMAQLLGKEVRHHVEGYGPIAGFHAIPGDDESMTLRPDTTDEEARDALLDRENVLVAAGHTHMRMDRDLGRWRVVNPGSVGLSFTQPGKAEWGLLTFKDGAVEVDLRSVEYDIDAAIADLHAAGHPVPEWVASKLRPQG